MAQTLSSCGDDDGGGTACVPGAQNNCNCSGGLSGVQYCNEEGTAFGSCDCGTGGGGDGGTSNAGGNGGNMSMAGSGGAGGPPPLSIGLIGAPCATTADCSTEADFFCIPETSNDFDGGGPEGGYCTVPCNATADCTALDGASGCYTPEGATQGFCVPLCTPGRGAPVKCGDRAQACYENPMNPTIGICFPQCRSDEGCGEGRFCDPGGVGLCLDAAPEGGGIGAACTPETEIADCASDICLTFRDENDVVHGFCSASCTYLSLFGCGFGPESTGPREAACLQEQFPNGGGGDLGFCFELCDTDEDCAQADWVCSAFNSEGLRMELGRQGQCVPQELLGGGGDAGPG